MLVHCVRIGVLRCIRYISVMVWVRSFIRFGWGCRARAFWHIRRLCRFCYSFYCFFFLVKCNFWTLIVGEASTQRIIFSRNKNLFEANYCADQHLLKNPHLNKKKKILIWRQITLSIDCWLYFAHNSYIRIMIGTANMTDHSRLVHAFDYCIRLAETPTFVHIDKNI